MHTLQPSKWAYLTFIKRLPFRDKSKPKWENIFGQEFTEGEWADINICANQCTIYRNKGQNVPIQNNPPLSGDKFIFNKGENKRFRPL
jgi:hypothetical protein